MRLKLLAISLLATINLVAKDYDVNQFGAKGDGKTLASPAIQKAIDLCSKEGGGRVVVNNGKFLIGTLEIKSNVELHIGPTGILFGSADIKDYKEFSWGGDGNRDRQPYHLIYASGQKNIAITGTGVIDGNGQAFWEPQPLRPRWVKAKPTKVSPMIELHNSTDVRIQDVYITNPAGWTLHLFDLDRVFINGIRIENDPYTPNSDGIDITGGTNIMISNCFISTCDDAICLKTSPDSKECRKVTVTNCVIKTNCVALKLGNESYKDMSMITMSNCVIYGSNRAIGVYSANGGVLEDILFSNIVADSKAPLVLARPIHISLVQRSKEGKKGAVRNVQISNFKCTSPGRILITAEKDNMLENIVLRDINLSYPYIETPETYAIGATSGQFSPGNIEAQRANAALVVENVKNFVVDGLMIDWPRSSTVPDEWRFPEMIENGSVRVHKPDFSKSKNVDFSVFWGKNIQGGYIDNKMAQPSDASVKPYIIENSTVKIQP